MAQTTRQAPSFGAWLLAAGALSTGGALVVYFIAGVSLWLGLGACLLLAGTAGWQVVKRASPEQRSRWKRRVRVGLFAGVLATIAYDASRFGAVALGELSANPWEALPLFGELLTGASAETGLARVVGFAYHVANGVGFAIAYSLVLGHRGVLAGIGWALGLEAAMLTFYPTWLDIAALQEFVSLSIFGHVAYGAVLGLTAARLLAYSRDHD